MNDTISDDCSGPFEPDWSLEQLSRAGLARLCREYQMLAMFHDRALLPLVLRLTGSQDDMVAVADGEWMGSSPIYSRRNLAQAGITGTTIETIFKSLQLDIGAPDHFLDFRFEVVSDTEGYFSTAFCGPHDHLSRLTRNDPTTVRLMCHDMEDRTFEATFSAIDPRARCEAVFRPPRPDDFTGHHCRWRLHIDEEAQSAPVANPSLAFMKTTAAARFRFDPTVAREPNGLEDYSGPMLDWFRLEEFSHPFLVRQAKEYALDNHLLMRAAYWTVDHRWGADVLAEIAPQHRAAFAPGLVRRLRDAFAIDGDNIEAVGKILQLDPVHVPDYTSFRILSDGGELLVMLEDCPGLHDDPRSPLGPLSSTPETPGFEHMAQAVNPQARVIPELPPAGAVMAWRVVIDRSADPVQPHPLVDLVNANDITTFDLTARPATPVRITRPKMKTIEGA